MLTGSGVLGAATIGGASSSTGGGGTTLEQHQGGGVPRCARAGVNSAVRGGAHEHGPLKVTFLGELH